MKTISVLFACIICMTTASMARSQVSAGTAFTYQGQLKSSGQPASGTYDMQFKLFADAATTTQVGGTICQDSVAVTNGLFTVTLDFGAQYPGDARWLQIGVRADSTLSNCGSGSYTTLSPLQPLTPAPYAAGLAYPIAGSA